MKKLLIASILSVGLVAGVQAQDSEPRHGQPDGSRIANYLELTDDQLPAFQAVMKEQFEKRRALHQEFREKHQAVEAETRSELEGVLTYEQLEKLDAMKEKRSKRMSGMWKEGGKKGVDRHQGKHRFSKHQHNHAGASEQE
jgi:hypothetical protein